MVQIEHQWLECKHVLAINLKTKVVIQGVAHHKYNNRKNPFRQDFLNFLHFHNYDNKGLRNVSCLVHERPCCWLGMYHYSTPCPCGRAQVSAKLMLGHMPLGNNVKLKRKEKGPSIRRLVGVVMDLRPLFPLYFIQLACKRNNIKCCQWNWTKNLATMRLKNSCHPMCLSDATPIDELPF